jgi:hypothetical protein
MSPMISAPRIAFEVAMKLRTSFVHSHRTPIEHLSNQRRNSGLGLRRLRHLDKSDTAWLASIPVLDDRDGCRRLRVLQKLLAVAALSP